MAVEHQGIPEVVAHQDNPVLVHLGTLVLVPLGMGILVVVHILLVVVLLHQGMHLVGTLGWVGEDNLPLEVDDLDPLVVGNSWCDLISYLFKSF